MSVARTLILVGGALLALGLVIQLAPQVPVIGKLPGDIRIERDGSVLYFPITSGILASAMITLVMQLIERMK